MLRKTITFKDLDGNDVSEDFYFNLNKAEVAEMELSKKGGFSEYLKSIIAEGDGGTIIRVFKEIITSSVGKRSEDNRRFIKSKEITDEFLQSEAYSEMFFSLVTDANEGAAFVRAIMPVEVLEKVDASLTNTVPLPDDQPAWLTEGREPTLKELEGATPEQMREAYRRKLTVSPRAVEGDR